MTNSEAIYQAQCVARTLSYNEPREAPAKHALLELSRRLGAREVLIRRSKDGWLMVTLFGSARFLSWREALIWRLFKLPPKGCFCSAAAAPSAAAANKMQMISQPAKDFAP